MTSPGNTIGGTAANTGNLISGNGYYGIQIAGTGASGNTQVENNVIQGNKIGTNASGTASLPNGTTGVAAGIRIESAEHVTVGGSVAGAGNLISGNIGSGINLAVACLNTIQGNYIGTNASGTAPLSGQTNGIEVLSSSSGKHDRRYNGN
ncbi:MAG: hypothetical protein U0930_09425 [Pirellulales bacterium]